MKLILSTSNLIGGPSIIRYTGSTKSNQELVSALRSNLDEHRTAERTTSDGLLDGPPRTTSNAGNDYHRWTRLNSGSDTLEVPALSFEGTALEEEREQYDITLKLFFLPCSSTKARDTQVREALRLVLDELHMPSVDLLIVSFPGIYFDEDDTTPERVATRGPIEPDPEALQDQIATWRVLEQLHYDGLVKRLGVAEFGHDRLEAFLSMVSLRPGVDQINLRDCCSVPKDLLALAKSNKVELLVHNDCSNILPQGTIRELLGPSGAAVLAEYTGVGQKRKARNEDPVRSQPDNGIPGEVQPQWVVKYTAVVRNRGVVESKGYFAVAEVLE